MGRGKWTEMPIYEYRCRECGETSEFLSGLKEGETISCRNCGSPNMERIMSAVSFFGRTAERALGYTCCGREERCETPPCSSGDMCRRDQVNRIGTRSQKIRRKVILHENSHSHMGG